MGCADMRGGFFISIHNPPSIIMPAQYLPACASFDDFTLWQSLHSICRLLGSSVPPWASFTMWSHSIMPLCIDTSPQCWHVYLSRNSIFSRNKRHAWPRDAPQRLKEVCTCGVVGFCFNVCSFGLSVANLAMLAPCFYSVLVLLTL